jgi:GNAT superfamily N-acetyltransferase
MELKHFLKANRKNLKKNVGQLAAMCGHFTPLEDWLTKQIQTASDILYMTENEKILGYLIADNRKTHLEVELLCVGEGKRGIGRQLLEKAEEIAYDYGCPEVQLDSQFLAEGFYKKLHYEEVSRNEHGIRMKKSI